MCFAYSDPMESVVPAFGWEPLLFHRPPYEDRPLDLNEDFVREMYDVIRAVVQQGSDAEEWISWEERIGGAQAALEKLMEWLSAPSIRSFFSSRFWWRLCEEECGGAGFTPATFLDFYFFWKKLNLEEVGASVAVTFYHLTLRWLGLIGIRFRFLQEMEPEFYSLWLSIEVLLDDDFSGSFERLFFEGV